MKLIYAVQLLLLVAVFAAPCCTTVCRATTPRTRCDPLALRPCVPAFILGAAPSDECCARLREQQKPCLCRYGNNPELRRHVISSRDGKRIAHACRIRVRGFRC